MARALKYAFCFISIVVLAVLLSYNISPRTFVDIYRGEDRMTIWVGIKALPIKTEISKTKTYKDEDLLWSPNNKLLAYLDETREVYIDKESEIKIFDPRTFRNKAIFVGNWHTIFFKWIDNETIRVYQQAGSGVRIYRDIAINIPEPFVASDHKTPEYWVPEKTF